MGRSRWQSNARPHAAFVSLCGFQIAGFIIDVENSDTYSAQITVDEFMMSVDRHLSLREDKTSMMIFGNGDGGGGPLAQMVRIVES